MQYSSDITSKVRIKRFSWDITRGTSIKSKDGPFGDKKTWKKVSQRQKIEMGDPLVSSGFVGYVKKVKNERGPLHQVFAGRTWS